MIESERCPLCGCELKIEDKEIGEITCYGCGYVFASRLVDRKTERRYYNPLKEGEERVGAPLTYLIHDLGLSTITGEEDEELSKLIKREIVESGDKVLIKTLSIVFNLSTKLALPDVVKENAALIVRRAWKNGLKIGRSWKGIAAASIYLSCQIFSIPKTIKDLSYQSGISKKTIWNCYRRIIEKIKHRKTETMSKTQLIVSKLVNNLRLKGEVEEQALKIIEDFRKELKMYGRKPEVVAAVAVYLACRKLNQKISQRRIAQTLSISRSTLIKILKEISENKKDDVVGI
ncbi:MAG: transcription initiation factor IIB family protein [Nitrososphaerota archaeon]|nr:transcription initiation factor IIB family protein [Candidatus Geocrenenecus dongiae]